MTKLLVFGRKVAGRDYVRRSSAYALIRRADGAVAIVGTSHGSFLLGGGLEGDETPQDALLREAREECGCELRVGKQIAVADEYLFSVKERTYFRIHCTFFLADIITHHPSLATDDGHILHWMTIAEAADRLIRESQRWAVRHAFGQRPNQPPEPTVMSVTPRADARVAPASTVAHL